MNIKGLNAVSVQQNKNENVFISTPSGFVISIPTLANLLLDLLKLGFMSPKVLEGILEEYYTE